MILSFHVGRRDGASADAFIRDLSQRVTGRFQLTTDSLRWYSPVVDEHLGAQVDYAMLLKLYGSRDITGPEWYGNTNKVIGTVPKVMNGRPDARYISTSHIERANLTVRQQVKRFARMTLAYSKTLENFKHAVALYMCWYNFVRVNSAVRMSPCMAHGLTNKIWSLEELLGAA
ncbi:MAG TPA: IS1 family transposase [Candidatus Sulfotelmatobacter sp.]